MKVYRILPLLFLFLCCESTKLSEIRYTHSTTNIRMGKSTSSTIIKTLKSNQKVYVIPSKNEWWLVVGIEYGNLSKKKKIGYIHRSLLHQNPIKQKVDSTVKAHNNKPLSMVLDVDKLIGLNINQIKNLIGKPRAEFNPTYEQKRLMPDITSTAEWFSKEIGLSIDFRSTEKIMYIFVMNDGVRYSADEIMKMANLKYNSDRYSVKHQRALNGSGITGIHVNVK